MSFDNVGGMTPVLDSPALPYIGEPIALEAEGANLADALAQLKITPKEGDAFLQPAEGTGNILVDESEIVEQEASANSELVLDIEGIAEIPAATAAPSADVIELDGEAEPYFTIEPVMPGDEGGGGGYIDVYEPAIYVPEGYTANDHYATEFILDPITGVFTIHFYFSTDPADFLLAGSTSLTSPVDGMGPQIIDPGFGDVSPLLNAPANGSRCTVTVTRTTTQTSPTSSFTFLGGFVNYTNNSGGTTTTTTTTRSYEGTLKNGRCVARNAR